MAFCKLSSPDANFWKENPEIAYMSPFAEFKKSKGDAFSGRIMAAIYQIWDPKSAATHSDRDKDQIIEDVNKFFLEEEDFDWDAYQDLVEAYKKDCITETEKHLQQWHKELEERGKFLEKWKWSAKDAKDKQAIMAKTKDLWNDYLEVKARVEGERVYQLGFGGYKKSLIEDMGSE